jgi:tRNA(Ile)-lysidine synthase
LLADQARSWGARFIATAHHRDDHVETVLQRVFRGTGIRGLRGIPTIRRLDDGISLIRPLRYLTRMQIETLLRTLGQSYCRDSMNDSPQFARNQLRDLVVQLQQQFGWPVAEALNSLSEQTDQICQLLARQTAAFHESTIEIDGGVAVPSCAAGMLSDPELVYALQAIWLEKGWPQQQMNRGGWLQLASLVRGGTESCQATFPGQIAVRHVDGMTRITRND